MHYNALNTGKRIQKLRKDKGLTQEQLAERLNLSTVHMAKIGTGQRSCSLDVLTEFAMFFNASLDYLVLGKITEKELTLYETLRGGLETAFAALGRSFTYQKKEVSIWIVIFTISTAARSIMPT